ncbi:OmpA family protein [Cochleicola gelatinilyticus]|uniref:OmpA-like domain-containing protein n=1 Tax=Cochleicola gelatinilyticus TaxID=1763537 RepID=A0A167IHY1_9FLAO|nr:OmpA family protein [Cochleicola gelatinilyticus]OAB79670.1 hypothetical protein ULVI_02670 [Cochleicola gelatinilyticus]
MKKIILFTGILFACCTTNSNAQFFKKLGEKVGKAAERGVERTVERRVERETEKSTDRTLDTIIEAPKSKKKRKRNRRNKNDSGNVIGGAPNQENNTSNEPDYTVSSNFDFTPGTVSIFNDDFSKDGPGDFPAKWDTNGSGELVTINGKKWFRLGNSSTFIPMTTTTLPENYTVQFDLLTQGLDKKTSSQAYVTLAFEDTKGYEKPSTWSMVEISPCQFIGNLGVVEKQVNGKRILRNQIGKDYRNTINGKSTVSVAVNKTRIRVWLNDNKIVDVPRLRDEAADVFKIKTRGLRDMRNVDEVYITNVRIGKAGADNRSKLLTEGRLSTNAILFNTGSATIKSGADAVLREVAGAMKSNPELKIMIVGHTDSDGNDATNLTLSKDRATAVKEELFLQYDVEANRIQVDGKGDTQPVADNTSASGKAQNRRVEFIAM